MPCYHPRQAHRLSTGELRLGRRTLGESDGSDQIGRRGENLTIACKKCIGCRTDDARDWAVRCTHESNLWRSNLFVTLDYRPEDLPPRGSLRREDLATYLKLVRYHFDGYRPAPFESKRANPIRYFACGEYGETTNRPHMHALVFNLRLQDLRRYDSTTFTSASLSELWPYGRTIIGTVDSASIKYVAGYVAKKLTRSEAHYRYGWTDPETGEWLPVQQPFTTMSLKPGIGQWWFDKYGSMDLRRGYLIFEGRKVRIPRFYEEKFKAKHPDQEEMRRLLRQKHFAEQDKFEQSTYRLRIKKEIKEHNKKNQPKPKGKRI